MSWKTGVQPKLGIESLEDRLLLAGDVSVRVEGDTLVIRGDDDDNSILITQGNREGTFVVTGLRGADETNGGTIINRNGRNGTQNSEVSRTYRNIENIMINMGDGDDEVFISGISESRAVGSRSAGPLEGHLHVNLGRGDDTLRIGTLFRAGVADGVAFDDDGNPIDGDDDNGGMMGTPLTEDDLQFDDDGNVVTDDDGNVLDADGNPILVQIGDDDEPRPLTLDDLQSDPSIDDDTGFLTDDDGNVIQPTDEFGEPILDDDDNEVEGIFPEDIDFGVNGEITDTDGNPIFFLDADGNVMPLTEDDLGTGDLITEVDGTLNDADGNPINVVTNNGGVNNEPLITSGGDEAQAPVTRRGEIINAVSVSRNVHIFGGAGDDDIELVDFSVGRHLTIDTGSGDDSLVGRQSDDPDKPSIRVFGNTKIFMGSGDDTVFVVNAEFERHVLVDGGSGFDVIVAEGNDYARAPERKNFESTDDDDAFGGAGINDGDDDDDDDDDDN